jgi:hypothetical protein
MESNALAGLKTPIPQGRLPGLFSRGELSHTTSAGQMSYY